MFAGGEPEKIAEVAAAHGFRHVTARYTPGMELDLVHRLIAACHANGGSCGVWNPNPAAVAGAECVSLTGADHYTAQAEGPVDWPAHVAAFRAGYPTMPAAVVTTFVGLGASSSGYDPSVSRPVIAAGFKCLPEAYVSEDPHATPAELDFAATRQLGWPVSQPVIGVFHGETFADYVDNYELDRFPGYFVWLAETMSAADYEAAGEFNGRH